MISPLKSVIAWTYFTCSKWADCEFHDARAHGGPVDLLMGQRLSGCRRGDEHDELKDLGFCHLAMTERKLMMNRAKRCGRCCTALPLPEIRFNSALKLGHATTMARICRCIPRLQQDGAGRAGSGGKSLPRRAVLYKGIWIPREGARRSSAGRSLCFRWPPCALR